MAEADACSSPPGWAFRRLMALGRHSRSRTPATGCSRADGGGHRRRRHRHRVRRAAGASKRAARVVISDQHERRLGEADELAGVGCGAAGRCRATSPTRTQVQALFAAAVAEHGGIDVLVNNAGLGGTAELHEMTDEQWTSCSTSRSTAPSAAPAPRCTTCAARPRRDRQQRVGDRLARAGGPGALRRGEGGCDGAHPLRRDRGGAAGVRVNAVAPSLAMHANLAKVTTDELLAELARARGVRSGGRAVGGGQRDRVPGLRLLRLHDRRDRVGQQPAPLGHEEGTAQDDDTEATIDAARRRRGRRSTTRR